MVQQTTCHRNQQHIAMPTWNPFHTFERRLRRLARAERGQALVEFAVVLTPLLLIIMAILFFGRLENYSNQMTQLAEQGARSASVASSSTTSTSLVTSIKAQAPYELQSTTHSSDFGALSVYIYYPSGSTTWNTVGSPVRVCVQASITYPVLFGITTVSPMITEAATMRIEAVPTATLATTGTPPTACS